MRIKFFVHHRGKSSVLVLIDGATDEAKDVITRALTAAQHCSDAPFLTRCYQGCHYPTHLRHAFAASPLPDSTFLTLGFGFHGDVQP